MQGAPYGLWLENPLTQKADRRTHQSSAMGAPQPWCQGTSGMGLADEPQEGGLQPGIQPDHLRVSWLRVDLGLPSRDCLVATEVRITHTPNRAGSQANRRCVGQKGRKVAKVTSHQDEHGPRPYCGLGDACRRTGNTRASHDDRSDEPDPNCWTDLPGMS